MEDVLEYTLELKRLFRSHNKFIYLYHYSIERNNDCIVNILLLCMDN